MFYKSCCISRKQYARHRDILNPDHKRAYNKSVEIVLPSESRQPARFSIKSLRWGMFRREIYRMLYFRCFHLDAYSLPFNAAFLRNRSTGFALLTRFVEFNYITWSGDSSSHFFLALIFVDRYHWFCLRFANTKYHHNNVKVDFTS